MKKDSGSGNGQMRDFTSLLHWPKETKIKNSYNGVEKAVKHACWNWTQDPARDTALAIFYKGINVSVSVNK